MCDSLPLSDDVNDRLVHVIAHRCGATDVHISARVDVLEERRRVLRLFQECLYVHLSSNPTKSIPRVKRKRKIEIINRFMCVTGQCMHGCTYIPFAADLD